MNFRSIADMDRAIANNLWKLDRFKFDVIVGIPRSGMIPASILATYLQLPLSTPEAYVAGIVHGRSGKVEKGRERVLLMDDTSNKGGAMARAVKILNQRRPASITRCAASPYHGVRFRPRALPGTRFHPLLYLRNLRNRTLGAP